MSNPFGDSPTIPSSSSGPSSTGQEMRPDVNGRHQQSIRKLQQTQAQVDEVVGIMKTNVEKVIERDTKLSMLDERAEALNLGASQFEQAGKRLRRKYWWQNLKVIHLLIN